MAIDLSILEKEDALKNLPDMALQQMLRQPSPNAPPFLVAAELKRREEMAKEFAGKQAAAQTAQQAPTVAHRLAGQQQPMPMSQAGAMAAPPQQPPMPQEAQLAMALSGATGRPPPELPTVNAQEGFSGAAVREIAKALRKEGTRTYAQRKAHQPFSSRERPAPVSPAGLALLLAAIQRQQSEPERASGGFALPRDDEFPRGRGRTVAAARPVTAANGTQGRTVYAQDGFRFSPEEVLDVERMGRLPSVQEQVLRSRQAWAERPSLGVDAANQAELEKLRADWRQSQADWSEYGPAAEILANFERERLERGGAAVEAVPEFPVSTTTSERLGQIPRPSEGMRNIYGQYGEGMPGPDEGERAADPRDEFIKRVDRFFSESDSPEDTRKRLWDLPVDFLKGIVTEWGPRVATKEDMARRDEAAKVWAQKRDAEAVREIAGASFAGEGPPLPRADPIRDAVSAAGPGVQPWPIPYTSPLDQPLTERVATETPIRQTGGDAGVAQSVYEPERRRRAAGLEALSMSDWTRPGAEDTTGLLSGRLPEGAVPVVSLDQSSAAQEILAPDGVGTVVPIQPSVSDDRQAVPPRAVVEQRVGPSVVPVLSNQPAVSMDAQEVASQVVAPVADARRRRSPFGGGPSTYLHQWGLQNQPPAQAFQATQDRIAALRDMSPEEQNKRLSEIHGQLNLVEGLPPASVGLLRKEQEAIIEEKRRKAIEVGGAGMDIPVMIPTSEARPAVVKTETVEKQQPQRLSPRQVGELKRTWGSKGIAGNNIGSRLEQKLSTFLSGADKDRVKIDDAETAKRIKAIGDSVRESAGEERRILIDQQNDAIEKIATADKASLKKISDGMAALKDFQETGRLPKKHRDALINAGLMEFGAALLDPNNPTLYGAFSAGLRGFQKIEKGKRKEYLDGLKYALTAETAQQTLAMKVRNSEAAARRQLAQFQVATQRGDEAAAVAAETRASNEINNARRYALQLQTAEIAQITAFASILNATKPGVRIQEFNMLMDKTLEEAQALAKEGDFTLMDKAFVTSGGKVTPKTEYFVDLFTSMSGSAFRDYIAIETFKRGERSEAARTRSSAAAAADRLIADFKHPLWKTILGREPTPDEWKLNKNDYYNKAVRHFLGGGGTDVKDPINLLKSLPKKS